MEGAAARHSLEVVAGPAGGSRIEISTAALTIGRDEQGDGRLNGDNALSRQHARIRALPGHGLLIEDLASTNGTWVNGLRIPAPTVVRAGDEIVVGGTTLRVAGALAASADATAAPPAAPPRPQPAPQPPQRVPALRVVAGQAPGAVIVVGKGPLVLGKAAEGAASLGGDPSLADEHARLSPLADGRLLLEELGPKGSTLVNGVPIPAPTVVEPGQRLQLGATTLEVVAAAAAAGRAPAGTAPALGGVQRVPAGLFALIGLRAPVKREEVVRTFFLALGWALAASLLVRTLAIEVFDVDENIPALQLTSILGAGISVIAANAAGFYKIFRRPDHRSIKRYLAPTFGMPIIFLVVNLLRLDDRGFGEVVTTIVVTVLPITICAVLMLRLRGRVARERVASVRAGQPAR